MSLIWPIARKEWTEIRRDRRALAFAFLMPVMMLLLYGYGVNTDVKNLSLAVLDLDRRPASRELLAQVTASGYFTANHFPASPAELRRLIDLGWAKAALVIPEDFSRDLAAGQTATLQAVVDGSDSNSASIAIGYLTAIVRAYGATATGPQARGDATAGQGAAPGAAVALATTVWFNPELKSTYFLVPGLMATILMMLAAILTSLTIAREWERGTMEGLIASPVRPAELVVGKLLPYVGIGFVDVGLVLAVGRFWFGVPAQGNLLLLLLGAGLFLAGALTIGLFCSAATRTQVAAFQLATMATMLPSLLLSGFFYPIENMPHVLQAVSLLVPARHFLVVIRGILLKGVGLTVLWPQLLVLAAYAVGLVALTTTRFQKRVA